MEKKSQAGGVLEPWVRLENKVVMVTGASSGLGRDFCLDLAQAGCRVIAAARRMDRLRSLCDQINAMIGSNEPSRAVAVELDVSANGAAIEAAVEKAWAAFGRIDAVINNAGIRGQVKSSLEISEEEWNTVVKTNLRGSWLVAKCVGTRMRDAGQGGSIINISSIAGLNRVSVVGSVAYSSSKSGLDSMTKVMALELGEYGIKVNSIVPGLFETEITEPLFKTKWLNNVVKKLAPLQTLGTKDPALTSLVRYLLHDSSSYVSGNIFMVEAGFTLPGFPIYSSL